MHGAIPSAAWRELVSRLLKSELSKRKMKYEDLSQRLALYGVQQSADNLRNKINRGIMGADLLLQIIFALDIRGLEKSTLAELLETLDGNSG